MSQPWRFDLWLLAQKELCEPFLSVLSFEATGGRSAFEEAGGVTILDDSD